MSASAPRAWLVTAMRLPAGSEYECLVVHGQVHAEVVVQDVVAADEGGDQGWCAARPFIAGISVTSVVVARLIERFTTR